MTSVTQTPLQFDSQDLRFTPQSWQGINSFLSLRWNADNITSDTLLSSFRKRITLPRIHCCRPLGRGIIFANFMHLAIRGLSNMLRSHCSGGMSVSSNLLATARLGMAPFLRWVWQVWQIHCLSLIRHFAVFISADVVTNINILSSQACLNHTWIFFFFFFYIIWPCAVLNLIWKWSFMTQCNKKWGQPLFVIWKQILHHWSRVFQPLCHSHAIGYVFVCISLFSLHISSYAYF